MNILCFEDKLIPDFLDMHLKMFILNGQRNISKCQYPYASNVVLQTEREWKNSLHCCRYSVLLMK